MAALTHNERLALFYPQNGNEKQIEIMVNPHLVGLVETTVRTPSGSFVYLFCFGCYAADKEKHTNSLPLDRNICNLIGVSGSIFMFIRCMNNRPLNLHKLMPKGS